MCLSVQEVLYLCCLKISLTIPWFTSEQSYSQSSLIKVTTTPVGFNHGIAEMHVTSVFLFHLLTLISCLQMPLVQCILDPSLQC